MADFGRISNSNTEVASNVPTGDAAGRVSSSVAEVASNVPTGDAVARISSALAEAAVNVPSGDAVARISSSLTEVVANETGNEVRVAMVLVEVFSKAPTGTQPRRKALGGGTQGSRLNTLSR